VLGVEPKKYQQRRPETIVLYRVIQQHVESFLHTHESSGKRLPKYVENEFRRYLECGLHAHGFARAVCETCFDELLLPFSCKLRGLCPSCNTRRMSNTSSPSPDGCQLGATRSAAPALAALGGLLLAGLRRGKRRVS